LPQIENVTKSKAAFAEIAEKPTKISPASIDHYLKKDKEALKLKA